MKPARPPALRPRAPQSLSDEDLRVIHGEIVRLEETVQNFLDFARLPTPQRRSTDLNTVISRALDLVRARSQQQGVDMAANLPGRPVLADVDGNQLGTVLVNLLMNAAQAMPADHPDQNQITLRLQQKNGEVVANTVPAHGVIFETSVACVRRLIDVSSVDEQGHFHEIVHAVQIHFLEFIPFGEH